MAPKDECDMSDDEIQAFMDVVENEILVPIPNRAYFINVAEDLLRALHDGVLLCHIVNSLRPNSVPLVNDTQLEFLSIGNITRFVGAVKRIMYPRRPTSFNNTALYCMEPAVLSQVIKVVLDVNQTCKEAAEVKIENKIRQEERKENCEQKQQTKQSTVKENEKEKQKPTTVATASEVAVTTKGDNVKISSTPTVILESKSKDKAKQESSKETKRDPNKRESIKQRLRKASAGTSSKSMTPIIELSKTDTPKLKIGEPENRKEDNDELLSPEASPIALHKPEQMLGVHERLASLRHEQGAVSADGGAIESINKNDRIDDESTTVAVTSQDESTMSSMETLTTWPAIKVASAEELYEAAAAEAKGDGEAQEKLRRQRRNVLGEIRSTEETFVTDLQRIVSSYLEPMRRIPGLPHDLMSVFGNMEDILSFSAKLLKALDTCFSSAEYDQCIGRVILDYLDGFSIYSPYCVGYPRANAILMKYEDDAAIQGVLKKLQQQGEMVLDFASYLLKPVQRVLKYPLLLRELLKATPAGHADLTDLERALEGMKGVALQINEAKRTEENKQRIFEIQTSIHGWDPSAGSAFQTSQPISEIASSFIQAGDVNVGGGGRIDTRHLFVFDTILVICKKKKARGNRNHFVFMNKLLLSKALLIPERGAAALSGRDLRDAPEEDADTISVTDFGPMSGTLRSKEHCKSGSVSSRGRRSIYGTMGGSMSGAPSVGGSNVAGDSIGGSFMWEMIDITNPAQNMDWQFLCTTAEEREYWVSTISALMVACVPLDTPPAKATAVVPELTEKERRQLQRVSGKMDSAPPLSPLGMSKSCVSSSSLSLSGNNSTAGLVEAHSCLELDSSTNRFTFSSAVARSQSNDDLDTVSLGSGDSSSYHSGNSSQGNVFLTIKGKRRNLSSTIGRLFNNKRHTVSKNSFEEPPSSNSGGGNTANATTAAPQKKVSSGLFDSQAQEEMLVQMLEMERVKLAQLRTSYHSISITNKNSEASSPIINKSAGRTVQYLEKRIQTAETKVSELEQKLADLQELNPPPPSSSGDNCTETSNIDNNENEENRRSVSPCHFDNVPEATI